MKSFSKRVASFAMAAAMVCSLAVVSPVDAEAAAKPKFEKTRTAITAGTNYTYAVKNVTSKQYVKVYATTGIAVKYNNAKVTKGKTEIKGGKTIKVKINANNKVANYKGKVTVKVFNKKTNKKVKDLSDSFTVKCTKLAVTNVEPATTTNNTYKYIVVKFNKALSSLDASEVSIREKATEKLVTVEKVVLAADKKSATLTLLGDRTTSGETFIQANRDYVLTVTKSNATASMDFNFPAVDDEYVVYATDASKSTITTGNGTFTVPSTITVDYEDILGRTVTYWYNKNNEITKLIIADETPVYGAFKVVSSNASLTNPALDENNLVDFVSLKDSKVTYKSTLGVNSATTTIYATGGVQRSYAAVSSNTAYKYAKLILNPNGTVRSYQLIPMTDVVLTESVTGQIVRESKTTSVSLDKYTIVKDGKTITINDIVKGDVVVYDSNKKFAEVYNEKVTGAITSVTSKTVTIDGKAYEWGGAEYIKNDESKTLTAGNADSEKVLVSYMNSKADATLYLDREGKVRFVTGTESTVVTNTTEYVLSEDAGNYAFANKHYLSLKASNGTDTLSDVYLDGISFKVVSPNGKDYINEKEDSSRSWTTSGNAVSFDSANWTNTTNKSAKILAASGNQAEDICTVGDIKKGSVLNVTRDSKTNAITAITVEVPTVYTVSANEVFKSGLGKISVSDNNPATAEEWYSIDSSTPVYEISKSNVVTKTEYSAFTKATAKDKAHKVHVFVNFGSKKVAKIVIDNVDGDVYGVSADQYITGVVTAVETSAIDGTHYTALTVMDANGNEKSFTAFSNTAKGKVAVIGQIVKVKYAVDGDKNTADDITLNSDVISGNACSGNNIKDNVVVVSDNNVSVNEKFELEANTKIFVVSADKKSIKTISYSELQTMTNGVNCPGNFQMYVHKFSEGHTDLIVVKEGFGSIF